MTKLEIRKEKKAKALATKKAAKAAVKNNNPKVSKKDKKDIQEAAEVIIAKKITNKKDLKYIYPADCNTLEARKSWRRKTRAAFARMNKEFTAIQAGTSKGSIKKIQAEIKTFSKEVLVNA